MILFGSEPMNCRFVCMSDDKISLSTSLLSQLFTGDKPWTGTYVYSEIIINFDINYQIANTCDWFGHIFRQPPKCHFWLSFSTLLLSTCFGTPSIYIRIFCWKYD